MESRDVALIEALLARGNGAAGSAPASSSSPSAPGSVPGTRSGSLSGSLGSELRRLWEQHCALEGELAGLRSRPHLTPAEQAREREIRKIKLAGRDRIEAILRAHRAEVGAGRAGRHRPRERTD